MNYKGIHRDTGEARDARARYLFIDAPHIPQAPLIPGAGEAKSVPLILFVSKASEALGFFKGRGGEFLGHALPLVKLTCPV